MAKNTVHRVEFANTTKREKARRKAIADTEREAARPRVGADRGTSVPAMTRERYRELVSGRGGQGDSGKWLSQAAETALEATAFEGLLASTASLAARGLGVLRPVFVRGGRGLRASVEGINDGVYIGADAAVRAKDPKDIASLRQFFSATDKTPFAKMDSATRKTLVEQTGWQQLPTGEVVKQIPKFEFNPKVWRKLEQFATRTRRKLSELGWDDIETALGPKSADGTVHGMYFEDALSGPGAEQYFKYYPGARKYVFRAEKRPDPKLMGEALDDEVVITDAAFGRGVKQVVDTIHHEPLHLIQNDSGLTRGGSLEAADNVMRALAGATDAGGAAFVRLPLSPTVTEAEKAAFRSNTQRMYRAMMESEKLVKLGQGGNALEKLANVDRSDADFFMYRHLGGEAGAHAVGHTASSASPTPVLQDAMREIGINPELVYDFSPALQVAKRAVRTTERIRDQVMGVHQDAKGGDTRSAGKSAETFDTPIPKELQAKYDAWYAQLPKNLQYTGDYDLQGAWLEKLGQPDKYEAAQNGHLDDYGKKPNHITFSTGSKWHDPKVPERTGGEWRRAKDGSWDFYPGTGNKASDDELKAYFEKYEKGNRVHKREVRQGALGGDAAGPETAVSEMPVSEPAAQPSGPRIVINPQVFRDRRDALCVAFNEAFRVVMEMNGFEPVSEPTEKQRKFFADTAYADDELQLRRTILARIATLDTSVKDPTDEQLEETAEMLEMVMEVGAPQNEWEQQAVKRLHDVVAKSLESTRANRPAKPAENMV